MNQSIFDHICYYRWVAIVTKTLALASIIHYQASCKKAIEIDPPLNTITTSQVFTDSSDAAAAISGLYSRMNNTGSLNPGLTNGKITLLCGMYADELIPFGSAPDRIFYSNIILPDNGTIRAIFWGQPYSIIYQSNACIEGIENSKTISSKAKDQFLGEAKFIRAFNYFYLLNLFGNVPKILSTNWEESSKMPRTTSNEVYETIISDLKDAQGTLLQDYSYSNNEKIRANQWAATALLARVYLYLGRWSEAETEATKVIDSGIFQLSSSLDEVFLANSNEAILQWNLNADFSPYNVTSEGYYLNPASNGRPTYYLTPELRNLFEPGDLRLSSWIKTETYLNKTYDFACKYKMGVDQSDPTGPIGEYYMVLRLAEQYLNRAEARAQQSNTTGAVADLDVIRLRAGITAYGGSTAQAPLLAAILHERQVELFAEWGHRWFDLKRSGNVDAIMDTVTPLKAGQAWSPFRKLFPIPLSELISNPFIEQNPGYN